MVPSILGIIVCYFSLILADICHCKQHRFWHVFTIAVAMHVEMSTLQAQIFFHRKQAWCFECRPLHLISTFFVILRIYVLFRQNIISTFLSLAGHSEQLESRFYVNVRTNIERMVSRPVLRRIIYMWTCSRERFFVCLAVPVMLGVMCEPLKSFTLHPEKWSSDWFKIWIFFARYYCNILCKIANASRIWLVMVMNFSLKRLVVFIQ